MESVQREILTIDENARDNKEQYDTNGTATKMSTLSPGNIDYYAHKKDTFTLSPLRKAMEKTSKKGEKHRREAKKLKNTFA